jgi:hypothetical protein
MLTEKPFGVNDGFFNDSKNKVFHFIASLSLLISGIVSFYYCLRKMGFIGNLKEEEEAAAEEEKSREKKNNPTKVKEE